MYCNKCGYYLSEHETVCPLCGTPQKAEPNEPVMQQDPVQNMEESYTQPAQPTPIHTAQHQQIPPVYTPQLPRHSERPVGIAEWIGSILLSVIPIVGFIMVLVWSFSGSTNPSKKNWARAQIILSVATTIIGIFIAMMVIVAGTVGSAYYY